MPTPRQPGEEHADKEAAEKVKRTGANVKPLRKDDGKDGGKDKGGKPKGGGRKR